MASHKATHSRSRKGNDTTAESYGEPQTPAELPKSSIPAYPAKRVILSSGASLERYEFRRGRHASRKNHQVTPCLTHGIASFLSLPTPCSTKPLFSAASRPSRKLIFMLPT